MVAIAKKIRKWKKFGVITKDGNLVSDKKAVRGCKGLHLRGNKPHSLGGSS